MSLQVWLPLIKDAHNQGVCGDVLTTSRVTFTDGGKLGAKYFSAGTITVPAAISNSFFNKNNMSFAFWLYPIGTESSSIIMGQNSMAAGNNRMYSIFQYSTPNHLHLSWQDETSSSTFLANTWSNFFPADTWTHCCITYNGSKASIYRNGSLYTTVNATSNRAVFNYDYPIVGSSLRRLNDVRIYNHCLSPREVKEISKGLILHYPLNINRPLTNLNKNSTYTVYNNYSGSGTTGTLTKLDEKFLGCDVYRLTMTPNSTSVGNFQTSLWSHGVYGFRTTFKANTKYCFWIYYRPVTHQDIRVGGTASNIGGWTEIAPRHYANEWNVVGQYRNGSVTEDKTDSIFTSFYTPTAADGVPISIDFCCPHLVEGSIEIIDNGDYQGNFNNTVEYDTSGYCYNGTITGTLITAADSPKYEISTLFNGSADIRTSNGSFSWWDFKEGTVCAWMKPTVTNSSWFGSVGVQADDAAGYRSFNIGDYANKASWIIGYDTSWGQVQSSVTMEVNTWYHLALTITNGTNAILYVNGESVKTGTITNSSGTVNANTKFAVGIDLPGGDERFTGQISDVRFYSTALSADDIKELYSIGAIIDNKGNMYAFELEED